MRLWDVGVGVTSPLTVRVARELQCEGVRTIAIASRNQCPGYAIATRAQLLQLAGGMPVIRDHGGPLQGPVPDIGLADAIDDVRAGFRTVHIDVSRLPANEQDDVVRFFATRLRQLQIKVRIEVGDERDTDGLANLRLVKQVAAHAVVAPAGTRCLMLRQVGTPNPDRVQMFQRVLPSEVGVVLHNADWASATDLDALREAGCTRVNVAPEIALAEVDAVLTELTNEERVNLMHLSYNARGWTRWFPNGEGTWDERARGGCHYVLQTKLGREITRDAYRSGRAENAVREAILRVA